MFLGLLLNRNREPLTAQAAQPNLPRVFGAWVGAALIGSLLASAVKLALPVFDEQVRLHATSLVILNGGYLATRFSVTLVSAAVIAGPMALVLGRWLRGIEIPWIAASMFAALVGFALPVGGWFASPGVAAYELSHAPAGAASLVLFLVISGVATGLVFGFAQAVVLRRYSIGFFWWIAASIFSHVLANISTSSVNWEIVGAGTRLTSLTDLYVETVAGTVLGSLIVALGTGLVLVRLLRASDSRPMGS